MPSPEDRLAPPDRAAAPARDATKAARPPAKPPRRRGGGRVLAVVRGITALVTLVVLVGAGVGAVVGWTIYQNYAADLPSADGLRTYQPPVMSRIYAGNDRLIAELASERRIFVPFSAIPDIVKKAYIAAEDKSFYQHKGVDPMAIARAALTDLQRIGEARRPVGASTITQQVARNMLLGTNDVSFRRKVKEALLALHIERTLSKERILELYLNGIYLGQGSYGVAAAAQAYFNKPLDQLSIAQAAMLAALPKSPTNYNPFRDPEAALSRRNWVIDRMVETQAITPEQGRQAQAEALGPDAYRRPETVPGAGWFASEVRRQLIERFGQDDTSQGGLIVHTSLVPSLQTAADDALRHGLMAYDHAHGGWRGPVGHLAGGAAPHGGLAQTDWAARLADFPAPGGILPNWHLAVVLDTTATQARLGWLADRGGDSPQPVIGTIALSTLGWARPASKDGTLGGAPRRMSDVMNPADVVMVEAETDAPPAAEPAFGASKGRRPAERAGEALVLRQIPAVSGALVSLDPQTGRVLAMSGGWSSDASQFNRAIQAQRQPGSSFKPFVYLTAMEKGISPSARFLDAPFVLGDWRPNNYEMTFGGPTPLHVALERSLNLVTVRVAQHVGMDAVAKTAIAYHLVDSMPRVLPAALGAVETTVMREAGAYASIADGGRVVQPSLVDSVQDRDGRVVWRPPGLTLGAGDPASPPVLYDPRQQVADPASAFQIVKMMEGVMLNHGTGVEVGQGLDRPIAGKTGTSQDYNDAWFAGFTPDLVTVVWVGFDNPRTLGDEETGAKVAGPIWHNFMQAALANTPRHDFRVPEGVTVDSWNCGGYYCVDAFKPDQEPGSGGVGGTDGPSLTGAVQVLDAGAESQAAAATPAQPPPPRGTGTGVDSGVGGLY
jgi:penicillin-binding protein 1A